MRIAQEDRKKKFEAEKVNIKSDLLRAEEKIIRARMQDDRRKWINKFLEIHEFNNLPNSINEFYKQKDLKPEIEENKDEKKKDGKKDAKKDGKDDGKGKGKKNEIDKFLDEHISIGPSETVVSLQKNVESYASTWASR